MNHQNLLKTLEIYETNQSVSIVCEYQKSENLYDFVTKNRNFSETDVKKIMKQLLSALKYLHRRNIMHRNIRPENILVCRDEQNPDFYEVKLKDFSIATKKNVEYLFLKCGTPGFIAPEIFSAKGKYDVVCDMFSAGVILMILYHPLHLGPEQCSRLTGEQPFNRETEKASYAANKDAEIDYHNEIFKHVPGRALDLLEKMLEKNPAKRITAADALEHAYLSDYAGDVTPTPHVRRNLFTNMMKLRNKYPILTPILSHCSKFVRFEKRSQEIHRNPARRS